MYLPLFLFLYESFWKGFESDQRPLTYGGPCVPQEKAVEREVNQYFFAIIFILLISYLYFLYIFCFLFLFLFNYFFSFFIFSNNSYVID